MAWYLVKAVARPERMPELADMLRRGRFRAIQPQGHEIERCLSHARLDARGQIWWEQQCFCSPPLNSEKLTVFDRYFVSVGVDEVRQGEGWHCIDEMPMLFPQLYQD